VQRDTLLTGNVMVSLMVRIVKPLMPTSSTESSDDPSGIYATRMEERFDIVRYGVNTTFVKFVEKRKRYMGARYGAGPTNVMFVDVTKKLDETVSSIEVMLLVSDALPPRR
jgi:hypothetical protein